MVAKLPLLKKVFKFPASLDAGQPQLPRPASKLGGPEPGDVVVENVPVSANIRPRHPEPELDFQPRNHPQKVPRQQVVGVPRG